MMKSATAVKAKIKNKAGGSSDKSNWCIAKWR